MGLQQDIKTEDLVGAYPTCNACGQARVMREAWAYWNLLTLCWTLKTVFDDFVCDNCGLATTPAWKIDKEFRLKRIARLNDAVRRGQGKHRTVVVTNGLQQFGEAYLAKVSHAVAAFDQFSKENDPHGEQDFGAITLHGEKLFWKIDYFDLDLKAHSPDKANADITHRVLTVMLASEY